MRWSVGHHASNLKRSGRGLEECIPSFPTKIVHCSTPKMRVGGVCSRALSPLSAAASKSPTETRVPRPALDPPERPPMPQRSPPPLDAALPPRRPLSTLPVVAGGCAAPRWLSASRPRDARPSHPRYGVGGRPPGWAGVPRPTPLALLLPVRPALWRCPLLPSPFVELLRLGWAPRDAKFQS